MTKIKNTKKGMAKKTLSMSLVVAMLATSNVPVWAAEFSDGSETPVATEAPATEAFADDTMEETTPVAEDTDINTEAATSVAEATDLILDDVTVSKSQTFGLNEKVAVTGTIKYKDGNDVKVLDDYYFGWRVKGTNNAIFTDHVANDNTTDKMSFYPDFVGGASYTPTTSTTKGDWIESQAKNVDWSQYAGKTLELFVYNNEKDDNIKIDPTVIGETTIEKCPIEGTLKLSKDGVTAGQTLVYNGKDFYYTNDSNDGSDNAIKLYTGGTAPVIDVTSGDATPGEKSIAVWDSATVSKYFDVAATKTARNAGEKLTVTATAKKDSPYIGTISAKELEVQKKLFDASDFDLSVAEGLSYQYTGAAISVPTDKISFKEKADKLAGVDLSSAVKEAETVAKGPAGQVNVKVTFDTSKLPNFKFTANETEATRWKTASLGTWGPALNQNVEITKRDLSADATTAELKYGRVKTNSSITDFLENLKLKDKSGKELPLTLTNDYNLYIENPDKSATTTVDAATSSFKFSQTGTYVVTISAKEGTNQTCVKSQKINVDVADNVIDRIETTNNYKPYYTGTEIKPSKSDLGKLKIYDVNDSTPEELQDNQYDIVGYSNNVNASKYNDSGKATTWGYVEIKIKGESSHSGQTYKIPFEIQPLTVSTESVTVPKTVTYNKGYSDTNAGDYNVQLVVTAKDKTGKIVKGLSTDDYTVKYEYVDGGAKSATNGTAKNELHDKIKATITVKNSNFVGEEGKIIEIPMTQFTEIVEKAITSDMIKINPSSYVYTGGNITPTYTVLDGAIALYDKAIYDTKGEYEQVSITNNKEVGTGTVTVKGVTGKYSGTASANFTITPANTSDVKVTFTDVSECQYTGRQVRPRTFKATLNGNDVTNQFEIVSYGENISGKGTVVLKPVDGNKNFTGSNITADFNIIKETVTADLKLYNKNGKDVTSDYKLNKTDGTATATEVLETSVKDNGYFDFDGTAKTFVSTALQNIKSSSKVSKATADDFEVKYIDNISGKKSDAKHSGIDCNVAYVYVVAKDGSGYTGTKQFTTADGTTIKGVVDYVAFAIKNVKFDNQNVYVQNATYAGGLPVKPNVLVQIKGNTLVEGKDYTLKLEPVNANAVDPSGVNFVNVTDGKVYKVTVTGINGYKGSTGEATWGIDKKDIKDCDVKVTNGVVTVMNGYIPVPTTEYTSKNNGDGTYTVTANSTSKNYTGSKSVKADGKAADEKPDAPMISSVKVVGNKATVILSGDSEGAAGYDYVISTDRDCITNKDYDSVNKNQVQTSTTFKYVQQGTYYAYCHAWKRDANGKKVFSDWSNAYPFVVSAITPDAPVITNVKVSGSTIKVTYKAAANATGYDVVLGTSSKKENGETRPYNYGAHKVLNLKEGTVTATFKNVPKGTWTVGMHAFNRTSEDGKKVFSPWSNLKKATVK